MSKAANQTTSGGGIGTKTLSTSQGEYKRQNVQTNQTKQSEAKNARNSGKLNS